MYIAVIDLQLSYMLAFLGREQIAETLSQTVVVEIIGVMLGYFGKSYFETREAEKIRLHLFGVCPINSYHTGISCGI